MEDYTSALHDNPTIVLKALNECLNGTWVSRDCRVGFTVHVDLSTTDLILDKETGVVTVSQHGFHTLEWTAPVEGCRLTQTVDDHQLLTEFIGQSGGESTMRLSISGPDAKYRGGAIRMTEPDVTRENHILSEALP